MLKAEVLNEIKKNKDLQYALSKIAHKEGSQTIYNWAREKKYDKLLDYRILYFLSLFFKTSIKDLLLEDAFREINNCKSIINIQ